MTDYCKILSKSFYGYFAFVDVSLDWRWILITFLFNINNNNNTNLDVIDFKNNAHPAMLF